jgi:REP element-mobilizing transposase RayT
MPEKFLNTYRIPSARLQGWDYKTAAAYFITICTFQRRHYFGEIRNGKTALTSIGKIVEAEWLKTPVIRHDMNLQLGEFVVMPNHFHGIIIIGKNKYNTTDELNTRDDVHPAKNKFAAQSKNLASVIRGFKSAVTTQVKKLYGGDGWDGSDARHNGSDTRGGTRPPTTIVTIPFAWQPRFYDHIIRDAESFDRIQQYIVNNPLNWKQDKFYERK